MDKARVLIADDEPDLLTSCCQTLHRAGYHVLAASRGDEALNILRADPSDLLVADLKMPGLDGIELLRKAREEVDSDLAAVIITAYGTIPSAVEAMREGAYDFLTKPFRPQDLLLAVERALRHRQLTIENRLLRSRAFGPDRDLELIGGGPAWRQVLGLVERVAGGEANVLIQGESGTGKELVARFIHSLSPRAEDPFVPIDCAAMPEQLLESELFGHEKGAFTGATSASPGLLEFAEGGTVLLDEIGSMSLNLQAKLLRTLEERQIRRVGGHNLRSIDVRFLAATNQDLERAVTEGKFREDLFYRLNVVRLVLPPLRERRGDIPLLAQHFLELLSPGERSLHPDISPQVMVMLEAYPWPGNVRELRNTIQHAVSVMTGDTVKPNDLPATIWQAPETELQDPHHLPYHQAKRVVLESFQKTYLTRLLSRAGGNLSQAARLAGLDRKSLYRLLKRHHGPDEA